MYRDFVHSTAQHYTILHTTAQYCEWLYPLHSPLPYTFLFSRLGVRPSHDTALVPLWFSRVYFVLRGQENDNTEVLSTDECSICVDVYIYIYTEDRRTQYTCTHTYRYMGFYFCVHMHTYIHTYIHRCTQLYT